jgi:hypothetical protein
MSRATLTSSTTSTWGPSTPAAQLPPAPRRVGRRQACARTVFPHRGLQEQGLQPPAREKLWRLQPRYQGQPGARHGCVVWSCASMNANLCGSPREGACVRVCVCGGKKGNRGNSAGWVGGNENGGRRLRPEEGPALWRRFPAGGVSRPPRALATRRGAVAGCYRSAPRTTDAAQKARSDTTAHRGRGSSGPSDQCRGDLASDPPGPAPSNRR